MNVRRTIGLVALVMALVVVCHPANAQDKTPSDPDLAAVKDDPALPRVLLIGDSISIGYTVPTRKLLQGKVNVHRIPENGGPTTNGLAKLAKWLGDERWDVIHFNWGLHDLKLDKDGKQQVPIEQYEKNLRELVKQLKATKAKLIWATTTPVPDAKVNPPRKDADVVAYNNVARKIMEDNSVASNDLYAFALPRLEKIQLPANVHFTAAGSQALAEKVAAIIEFALARANRGAGAGKSLRVLILSGIPETHHDYKGQCPNMEKLLKGQGHEVVLRDRAIVEEGKDGDAGKFDVLVLMSEKWRGDESNRRELLKMVREGMGLVVIHMAYVPCAEVLGGKASRNGKTGAIKIEIVDRKHPITDGVEDFTAGPRDELYAGVKLTAEDVHVLARGQDTLGTWEPVAWVRVYGKGRVFYISLGHSTESQQNPGFVHLVTRAVRWAGEQASSGRTGTRRSPG